MISPPRLRQAGRRERMSSGASRARTTMARRTSFLRSMRPVRARTQACNPLPGWAARTARKSEASASYRRSQKIRADGTAAGTSVAHSRLPRRATATRISLRPRATSPSVAPSKASCLRARFLSDRPVFSQPATYLGSFTLDGNGVATFTAAAVPEPSAWGLLGAALLSLIIIAVD